MKCLKLIVENSSENFDKIKLLLKNEGLYQDSPKYIWTLHDFVDDFTLSQEFSIRCEDEQKRISNIFTKYNLDFYGIYKK